MSVEANFNKLVIFKKFNNYFNRKIIGGPDLKDYFKDGDFEKSEETFSYSYEFEKSDLFDFIRLTSFRFAATLTEIPLNVIASDFSYVIENDGGLPYGVSTQYDKETRKLEVLVSATSTFSEADIPDNFKLIITFNYKNNSFVVRDNVNFNPNEGIRTEIVLNNLSFEPDYILVLNENDEIIYRWFVLETVRTRNGQNKLSLQRDVIYDNLENLKESPVFVQRAMLKEDDPFIVNSEGMSVNQIKTAQQPLFDISQNAWIIVYIAKNAGTEDVYGEMGIHLQIHSLREKTTDENYDMIAIPFYNMSIYGGGKHFGDYSKLISKAIGLQLDANCYDIQLLPYCPVSQYFDDDGLLHLPYSDANKITYGTIEQAPSSANGTAEIFLQETDFPKATYNELTGKWSTSQQFTFFDFGVRNADSISSISSTQIFGATASTITATFNNGTKLIDVYLEFDWEPTEFNIQFTSSYTAGVIPEDIGYFFYCPKASFKNRILQSFSYDESLKELSNLEMFRFVSPNYQGSFEMNIGKNGGKLREIIAYCTYKPYTPFIKVAPKFEFLYGTTYIDQRGLICAGDFSLPRSADAWETFQLNNKNYQNIFNREIQNMDFNYNIDLRNQIISGATGVAGSVIGGAAAGAVAGSIVPGIGTAVGAAVGAVAGGISSATGMVVDTITMADKYRENKSLAIDKFNYQLGNIKALPYTLTKVGSFDIVSAIWPFVERYQCTSEEKEAFRRKIEFESMTVMRIDKISNFYNKFSKLCYFKGELIRNETIAGDFHILSAIYAELLKGVYI